jgi:hypothetical protein
MSVVRNGLEKVQAEQVAQASARDSAAEDM